MSQAIRSSLVQWRLCEGTLARHGGHRAYAAEVGAKQVVEEPLCTMAVARSRLQRLPLKIVRQGGMTEGPEDLSTNR